MKIYKDGIRNDIKKIEYIAFGWEGKTGFEIDKKY